MLNYRIKKQRKELENFRMEDEKTGMLLKSEEGTFFRRLFFLL